MKRIVDEIIEIPLGICEILIENFELDLYELDFISPADLVQEIASDKEEILKLSIRDFKERVSKDDFPDLVNTSDNLENKRELLRSKITANIDLLTIDLEYFLHHLVVTLSNRRCLIYLNSSHFVTLFTKDVCEEIKLCQLSKEVWRKVTRLFTYSFGLLGRMICLTYWADDDIADETAYYLLEPDEESEKEKDRPLDNRLWFSLNNVIQRLRPLGVTKEDIHYLCSNGEIECCIDIVSLDRPVRRFELNTNYQNKVSRLIKFERTFPPEIDKRVGITSLGLRYVMPDNSAPMSRFLAIDPIYVGKILYQGFCTYWEAGTNGFEAVFGDTSEEYNQGVPSFETIRLTEDHLIITAKEARRLESKYSENKMTSDSDGPSKGAWKMMGVLFDLLKETNIYKSDNDIKAAILAKATEHKMKGMSQRNLDTFFKKANESKSER